MSGCFNFQILNDTVLSVFHTFSVSEEAFDEDSAPVPCMFSQRVVVLLGFTGSLYSVMPASPSCPANLSELFSILQGHLHKIPVCDFNKVHLSNTFSLWHTVLLPVL